MPSHYEVAIAGAGPTGLTLANLLGAEGIRTLLVERNPTTVNEPRAVSIDDEALRTMQAIGLADTMAADIVPGYGYRYLDASGRCFASVQPARAPYGYPRRSAFRQPVLERHLRGGLVRFPNVQAAFGCTLESLRQDGRGVVIGLRDSEGRSAQVQCEYLVGCDGAASAVRHLLGISLEGSSFSERWLVIDLEQSPAPSPQTLVFCDPARPGIALPGPDQTRRFEFKLHPHERDEELLALPAIRRLLAAHGADQGSIIRRTVVYRFHARVAQRWMAGRALLAGDAAHLSPPFAGQGMNSGIRDAHNLAWKLAAVLRGRLGAALLDTYEAERRPHVREMLRLALRMGRIMAPRSRPEAAAVALALRLLGVWPPARDYVAEMRWRPAPRFTSGFFVSDGAGRRRTLVGRLFPQPWVLRAGGGAVRLDEITANRFALVAWSAAPGEALAAAAGDSLWKRLEAKLVVVLPCGAAPATGLRGGTEQLEIVGDRDGALGEALAHYPEHVIILRPDHYVAACMPIKSLGRAAAIVGPLVSRTRSAAGAPAQAAAASR